MAQKLIGGGFNQVPTNGMLGDLAFVDSVSYQANQIRVRSDSTSNLKTGSAGLFKTGTAGAGEVWYNDAGTVKKYLPYDYTPLQQGGGLKQLTTKVSIGASSDITNGLRASVGTTDIGTLALFDDQFRMKTGSSGYLNPVFYGSTNSLNPSNALLSVMGQNVTDNAIIRFGNYSKNSFGFGYYALGDCAAILRGDGLQLVRFNLQNGDIWSPAFGGWLTVYVQNIAKQTHDTGNCYVNCNC